VATLIVVVVATVCAFPLNRTVCTALAFKSLSVMLAVPVLLPAASGIKSITRLQLAPADKVDAGEPALN
jgi:hypothetical protein